MTDISRIRKRPLEADPAASGRAANEIDIAACATISYSSEDPDHPVEHLLDRHSGPGATGWISARPDTIEHVVVEFDQSQTISPLVYEGGTATCGLTPRPVQPSTVLARSRACPRKSGGRCAVLCRSAGRDEGMVVADRTKGC